MARLPVQDSCLWINKVQGDEALRMKLADLNAGDLVTLTVNGQLGRWQRMNDGKDGRPTYGLRPIGETKDWWNRFWPQMRGEIVPVQLIAVEQV